MFNKLKYDSDGTKYRKQEFDPEGNLLNDETYFSNLVLRNGRPYRILHDDGYVNLQENGLVGELNFHVKDHPSVDGQVLGNVRAVLSETPDRQPIIVQASGYFPFGMLFQSEQMQTSASANANKYLYNGKEVQDMPGKWYDYGARFYDAGLGRWFMVDPLAEKYYKLSPYTYAYNNPIYFIDIDGQEGNPYSTFKNLSSAEKKFVKKNKVAAYKIFRNAKTATKQTKNKFGFNGRNDRSDAFRHTLWQALNTQSVGADLTQQYADAHETATPAGREKEKEMDDHNNSLGIQIGLDNPDASLEDIIDAVSNALDEAKAVVIDPETGKITPTTPDPKPEPEPKKEQEKKEDTEDK